MSRAIFSLYIEIPDEELDFFDKDIIRKGKTPTNIHTKQQFQKHYQRLIDNKKRYAEALGVKFFMYEYSTDFKEYAKHFKENYPFITMYNIVNKYKLALMERLVNKYDEVLYLDFDAIPVTNENFFDVWDLSKGIAILHNNDKIRPTHYHLDEIKGSIRSPSAKYFNAMAMLEENGLSPQCDVVNTGIIGCNKEHWNKLNYFSDLDKSFELMHYLRSDEYKKDSMYPINITNTFGYDNETIFSYKLKKQNVPVQWLNNQWHYFYDYEMHIPKETKIVHAINKEFDYVWRYEKKINF